MDPVSTHAESKAWMVTGRSNKAESPLPPVDEESDCTGYNVTKVGWYDKSKILHNAKDSIVVSGNKFDTETEHDVSNGKSLLKFCTTQSEHPKE